MKDEFHLNEIAFKRDSLKDYDELKSTMISKLRKNRAEKTITKFEKEIYPLDKSRYEIKREDFLTIFNNPPLTLDNVLSVYRGFREIYDYMLRYEDSSRMFVGEMNLRAREVPLYEKIFYKAYHYLALYGESVARPLAWAVLTIFGFALAFALEEAGYSMHSLELELFLKNLEKSAAAFFQMGEAVGLSLAERIAVIPILGSFIISLRRKLERRIRH